MPLTRELERFFELSPDACCVMTFEGVVKAANPAWATVLGHGPGEIERTSLFELLHPEDRARVEGELVRHERSSFRARLRAKDGSYRMLRFRASARAESQTVCVLGREEPSTITRAERLLSLGQMALGVVHDLKNVLVHPLGLQLQRIERALESQSTDRARASIAGMRDVLRDGLQAIDRMLKFSRPTERASLARDVDLDDVVWRATEIARAYARSVDAPHEIEIAYEPGPSGAITADAFELLAAFVNVIYNAVDAVTERGGTITVRTGGAHKLAWLEVLDDGPGMSNDVLERIFEPFFTTKREGIGIGLAMVKTCIERHTGSIHIETDVGSGTKFRIELPR